MPDLGFEELPQTKIKVVAIAFSFNNVKLLQLLYQRGESIRADNFEKVSKIESEINKLKEKDLDKLT